MNIANIRDAQASFQVLQTTALSQTAVMTLNESEKSSQEMSVHKKSDQVVLILWGEIKAEVGGEHHVLRQGDICIVPAGIPHRFSHQGTGKVVAFNVYTPPEYATGERE